MQPVSGPSRAALWPLVAFPLVLVLSDLLRLGTSEASVADLIEAVASHRERWFAGTLVGMVGIALMAGGGRALADLLRPSAPRLVAVSYVLVLIGAYSGVALMTTDLIPWLATDARAMPGASSVVDLVFGQHVLASFYGLASCSSLGFGLFAVALWRTSHGLRPAAVAFAIATVVFLAGRASNTDPLRFAGDALFLVAAVVTVRASENARLVRL